MPFHPQGFDNLTIVVADVSDGSDGKTEFFIGTGVKSFGSNESILAVATGEHAITVGKGGSEIRASYLLHLPAA